LARRVVPMGDILERRRWQGSEKDRKESGGADGEER
jgi:hypothetical protein